MSVLKRTPTSTATRKYWLQHMMDDIETFIDESWPIIDDDKMAKLNDMYNVLEELRDGTPPYEEWIKMVNKEK